MNSLLRAEQLTCKDAKHLRVEDLNFALNRGESVGLLGTNGAGKSTTLALLAGALAPTAGRVFLLEQDLGRAPREHRNHLGLLPETPPLHPDLTVAENLQFAADLHGLSGRQQGHRCAAVSTRCGISSLNRRLARRLSRGEAQRVGIAMALVHDPQVLLLDEPTAGLDPLQAQDLRALLRELQGERAILLSTHLLQDVEAICNRAVLLHAGKQAADLDLRDPQVRAARVRLRHAPDAATLQDLPGVKACHAQDERWWLLEFSGAPRNDLAEVIAARAWGLEAYLPVTHDLAERFTKLATRGEQR